MMIKLGIYNKAPSKKKEKNAGYYPEMIYPGEKIQIDVKYVPKKCLSKELQEMGERYYQYTAIIISYLNLVANYNQTAEGWDCWEMKFEIKNENAVEI